MHRTIAISFFHNSLFIVLLAFLFAGCDKDQTAPAGISGVISVEGASSEGAVALVYDQIDANDDVSIWSVPKNSSVVGFDYQTEVGFDFRTIPPIKTDTVGPNGEFSFSDLSPNKKYVVVAKKDSFGWTRPKEVSVGSEEVDGGTYRLFPETVYGLTVLTENTTWLADRHYVLKNTFFVNNGVTLTIQPGAVVRIGPNVLSININGTIVCDGTPNDFIYFEPDSVANRQPQVWTPFHFYDNASPPMFRYSVFRHADYAVNSSAAGGLFENCYFYNMLSAGVYISTDSTTVRRCMFERSSITASYANDVLCEHSVFQTSDPNAIFCYHVDRGTIYCNWFRDCGGSDSAGSGTRGVMGLHWTDNFDISRNFIETSWYAISLGSGVDASNTIHNNEFTRCNRVMNVGVTEEERFASYPNLNFNCFTSIDLRVISIGSCQHNNQDIDATNNFWNTNSVLQIQNDMIIDCRDNGASECGCVNIEPILQSCPNDVGICTN